MPERIPIGHSEEFLVIFRVADLDLLVLEDFMECVEMQKLAVYEYAVKIEDDRRRPRFHKIRKWSHRESNPDLLNAIQASSRLTMAPGNPSPRYCSGPAVTVKIVRMAGGVPVFSGSDPRPPRPPRTPCACDEPVFSRPSALGRLFAPRAGDLEPELNRGSQVPFLKKRRAHLSTTRLVHSVEPGWSWVGAEAAI